MNLSTVLAGQKGRPRERDAEGEGAWLGFDLASAMPKASARG